MLNFMLKSMETWHAAYVCKLYFLRYGDVQVVYHCVQVVSIQNVKYCVVEAYIYYMLIYTWKQMRSLLFSYLHSYCAQSTLALSYPQVFVVYLYYNCFRLQRTTIIFYASSNKKYEYCLGLQQYTDCVVIRLCFKLCSCWFMLKIPPSQVDSTPQITNSLLANNQLINKV